MCVIVILLADMIKGLLTAEMEERYNVGLDNNM